MADCLGLFVQDNLIKYAKVSKENNSVKIENYGIKFYDQDIEKTIKQIVDETFSYKTPISINMFGEKYTNTQIFSLLSDSDKIKSIKTEFEFFCNETGKNKLAVDYKGVIGKQKSNEDKINVLYSFAEKGDIAERIQLLDSYRLVNLSPVSFAVGNLQKEENCIIVNIEDRTEVTTVLNGVPESVQVIDAGMNEILKKIAERENSTSKAYEICKNTTLYTASSQNLQSDSNEYLEIIVPTMYKITEEIKKNINKETGIEVEKMYITGTGAIINNIDLYFQENFLDYKCEILTPYFVDKTSLKLNIKDYIEVNSAVALAIQVLDKKNKGVNFSTTQETWEKIRQLLTSDVSTLGKNKTTLEGKVKTKKSGSYLKDIYLIRFLYSSLIILLTYCIVIILLYNKINDKTVLAKEIIDDAKTKTEQINNYDTLINARTKNYESILEQLEEATNKNSEKYKSRNAIPNLLSEIMFAVPKEAQILSIENESEKHIKIEAQASEYQYLGYFKSEIQNKTILTNVTSTPGKVENGMIHVTLEGDLPY